MTSPAIGYEKPPGVAYRLQEIVAFVGWAIEQAIFWLACALLMFLVVALFLQVFYRYVLELPLPWSEEGARFGLVWFTMASACIAAREGQHFIFRWVTLAFSETQRFWLRRLVDVLAVVLMAIILKYSIDYLGIVAGQTASGTGLNMQVPYGGITFGAASLMIIYITELLDALLSLTTGQTLSKREKNESVVYALLRASPADK